MKNFWLKTFLFFFCCFSAFALSPENHLADESQEQRAMKLFLQVRCLVCNGQVIENSDTKFSFEMRKTIRQKIAQGMSDEEIKNWLKREFGENILTTDNKTLSLQSLILWVLPTVFAVLIFCKFFLRMS